MSQALYPVLPGQSIELTKTPNWGTRMQRATSGRTLRTEDYVNPIWNFTLTYEVLEDWSGGAPSGMVQLTSAPNAVRTILDFFNSRAGAFDDFLIEDPRDNQALAQLVIPAPTDTTGTIFQLTRALQLGGFAEWIIAPNVVNQVYFNGSPVSPAGYSVDPTTGLVTFSSPVTGGITVTADLSYFFRVYFTDAMSVDYFAFQLAEMKQVKLTSIVL